MESDHVTPLVVLLKRHGGGTLDDDAYGVAAPLVVEGLPPEVGETLLDVGSNPDLGEEVLIHVDVGDETAADGAVHAILLLMVLNPFGTSHGTYAGGCEEASPVDPSSLAAATAAMGLLLRGLRTL